ncbi:hypothetical protein EPO05_00205 [Patescibacteria group bacterium]|nr:MAG: hypothetical protein EPO05_00205 [Patescibacteria group bacterium]
MPSKNNDKNRPTIELEWNISPVLVTNNHRLKPYLELFECYPENAMLRPLGTIVGFFEMADTSDDSAYIVNFLTAEAKKEYYVNHRRSIGESFDAALHRVNLALAEITKNGNVQWIGKLNGALCVVADDFLHLSVCGSAKVLLLRNQSVLDLSQDFQEEDSEPSPLKTFTNVSSGKLELGDKIIVTSSSLFTIFSLSELRKAALRFPPEKFVQFLKTALINELDSAATIIIDIAGADSVETTAKRPAKTPRRTANVFSEEAFRNPVVQNLPPTQSQPIETPEAYTDEKTGHIYVQGDDVNAAPEQLSGRIWSSLSESLTEIGYRFRGQTRRLGASFKRSFRNLSNTFVAWRQRRKTERELRKESLSAASILPAAPSNTVTAINAPLIVESKNTSPNKLHSIINLILGALRLGWQKVASLAKNIFRKRPASTETGSTPRWIAKLTPHFSRIKAAFSALSYPQRLYALLALLAIFVFPLVYLRLKNDKLAVPESPVREESLPVDPLLSEKNAHWITNPQEVLATDSPTSVVAMRDNILVTNRNQILLKTPTVGPTNFSLPANAGQIKSATPLNDLNLLLLLTDQGKLYSFSPVSKEIKENRIELPKSDSIRSLSTYLTYLYVVTSTDNKLFRYPRAEGGFGEAASWLKDSLPLATIQDMAIDENVYLLDGELVRKFFRGQQQTFSLEALSVPLVPSHIATDASMQNIYVLDKTNGRIVQFSKDGSLVKQFIADQLKGSPFFSIDEQAGLAYFATSEGAIKSFSLQ